MAGFWMGVFVAALIVMASVGGAAVLTKFITNARECNVNNDCRSDSYCGSDFACHTYPNIQQTVVKNDYVRPAIILAVAVVLAAGIVRWNNLYGKPE